MTGARRGHAALVMILLAVVASVLIVAASAVGHHGKGGVISPSVSSTPTSLSETTTAAPTQDAPSAWRPPATTTPARMAAAFGAAIWTYDSRMWALDDWRAAVGGFVDPAGPAESGDVARAMLPLWPQWEDLARGEAHARVASMQVSHPMVLADLERDPRAPRGWHAFLVLARQEVVADGRASVVQRQATIAVICRPRCFVWSVSAEGPR